MQHLQRIETRVSGKPARFYIDGVRVSRVVWDDLRVCHVSTDSIHTRASDMGRGITKRQNYSCVTVPDWFTW